MAFDEEKSIYLKMTIFELGKVNAFLF